MSDTPARLLVLDDDPVISDIIAMLAQDIGMQARKVDCAEALFESMVTWTPTHISVDLMMPGLDGVEILARMSGLGCRAGIVIISGVDARVLESAMRVAREHDLCVLGTLQKPFCHAEAKALLSRRVYSGVASAAKPSAFDACPNERRRALAQREFVAHFQPKVDTRTWSVVGFEALVRWHHPTHGVLSPDHFIGAMERDGTITQLSAQVLEQAMSWLARGASNFNAPVSIAVNLSALDIADPSLAACLSHLAKRHGVDPSRVIVEITESNAMRDPRAALAMVTRLRVLGFKVALDDFGTGYSSMAHLARLPLSSLKVDKSFVQSMATSAESRKIVESIVRLGNALELELVAEGVETHAAAAQLRDMGCQQIQGHLISPALAATAVDAWLTHWEAWTTAQALTNV